MGILRTRFEGWGIYVSFSLIADTETEVEAESPISS
jgi:hypothetical protein